MGFGCTDLRAGGANPLPKHLSTRAFHPWRQKRKHTRKTREICDILLSIPIHPQCRIIEHCRGDGYYSLRVGIGIQARPPRQSKNNMAHDETILRFEKVSFEYGHNHPILKEGGFSVRRGTKITVMGQNGAGKSTLFALIMSTATPEDGNVHIANGATIATARQVIPRDEMDITVRVLKNVFQIKI